MDLLVRKFWRDEILLALTLCAVFLVVLGVGATFPRDARLFPSIVGTAGLVLSAAVLVNALRLRRAAAPPEISSGEPIGPVNRFALAVLAPPLFGLVFWIFGFYVASLLTAFLMPLAMGYRNRRFAAGFAVATVAATAVLFPVLLDVDLPHGLVGDWLIDVMRAES